MADHLISMKKLAEMLEEIYAKHGIPGIHEPYSERRLQQLAERKVIATAGYRKTNPYIAMGCLALLKRSRNGDQEPVGLTAERELLVKAQREREEFDLAVKKGEYYKRQDLRRELGGVFMTLQERLLTLPGNVAPHLEGESRDVIQDRLQEELRQICNILSTVPGVENGDHRGRAGKRRAAPRRHSRPAGPSGAAAQADS